MGLPAVVSVAVIGACSLALPAQSLAAAPSPAQSRPSVGAFDVRSNTTDLPSTHALLQDNVVDQRTGIGAGYKTSPEPVRKSAALMPVVAPMLPPTFSHRLNVGGPPIGQPLRAPMWLHRYNHAFVASHWYGLEIGIDTFLANKFKGAMAAGASVAAFAGSFGGGALGKVIAAALGVSAAALQVCQKSDGWVHSYLVAGHLVCNPI